jgi:hypothetical protein
MLLKCQRTETKQSQSIYAGILTVSRIFLTSISLSLEWVKWYFLLWSRGAKDVPARQAAYPRRTCTTLAG